MGADAQGRVGHGGGARNAEPALRAILWDHDGVLVDSERLYYQATREILASVGVAYPPLLFRQLSLIEGRGVWHLVRERGFDEERVAALHEARNARYLDLLSRADVIVPGALPLLGQLAARFRMAVVTSSLREHFDAIHPHLAAGGAGDGSARPVTAAPSLRDFVEFVLTREDYEHSKPDPEPYLRAVHRLGLTPAECLVVEDSPRGLQAARAAGIRCWIVESELMAGFAFDGAERRVSRLLDIGPLLLARDGEYAPAITGAAPR